MKNNINRIHTVPLHMSNGIIECRRSHFHIAVEERGRQYVACLYEVDIYGYGTDIPEAIQHLEAEIVCFWKMLRAEKLGRAMLDKKLRIDRLFRETK